LIISSRGDVPGPEKNASILTADRDRNPSAPFLLLVADQDYFNPHRSSESQIHLAAHAVAHYIHVFHSSFLSSKYICMATWLPLHTHPVEPYMIDPETAVSFVNKKCKTLQCLSSIQSKCNTWWLGHMRHLVERKLKSGIPGFRV
jgi:hypothetical protein